MSFLMQNIVVAVSIILFAISVHAWADANKELRKTEDLYNSQPRVNPLRARLKWTSRIIGLLTLKRTT